MKRRKRGRPRNPDRLANIVQVSMDDEMVMRLRDAAIHQHQGCSLPAIVRIAVRRYLDGLDGS